MPSIKRQKGKSEDTPAPEMSLLHAPIKKGWGKGEWIIWNKGYDSHSKSDGIKDYDEHHQQIKDAVKWVAPDEVVLKISIKVAL